MLSDKHFIDWEHHVFGYGYGTGEPHTLKVLVDFLWCMPIDWPYRYDEMEKALGPEQFWLLANALLHHDILEYGTSPRGAWLTDKGKELKLYLHGKTMYQICELIADAAKRFPDYLYCFPGYCNCDDPCNNPLWE